MTTWQANGSRIRVGILINPLGGKNRNCSQRLLDVAKELLDFAKEVTAPKEIEAALSSMSEDKIDLVIISGGDGTVQAVLSILFRQRPFDMLPLIAVLPGGTTNLIAKDVGIKGNQKKALKRLGKILKDKTLTRHCTIKKRHVMRLRYLDNIEEYGMFLGAAGIYDAVVMYYKSSPLPLLKRRALIFSYVLKLLMAGLSQRQMAELGGTMKISVDGKPIPDERFLLLLSTTLERLFFGLRPFWSPEKKPIHLTAVRKRPKKLLSIFLQLLCGRISSQLTERNGYYSLNGEKIEIYTDTGIALDGQIYQAEPGSAGPFHIENGGQISILNW